MENQNNKNEATDLVQKRVKDRIDFYNHLVFYLVFNGFFMILNLLTEPQELWFFYPLVGWGIVPAYPPAMTPPSWNRVMSSQLYPCSRRTSSVC